MGMYNKLEEGTPKVKTINDRIRKRVFFVGESRTVQAPKDACDINNIVARYKKTGFLPVNEKGMPEFGDFADIGDFQSNMNKLISAQEMFMQLPASLRKKFGHDAGNFIDYCMDNSNYDEAVKLLS